MGKKINNPSFDFSIVLDDNRKGIRNIKSWF